MSDTPRTDRAEAFDDEGRMVSASFARTLERETISLCDKLADRETKLAAARAELATAREALREMCNEAPIEISWGMANVDKLHRWRKAAGLDAAAQPSSVEA